ncbi:MAG TPA: hypothetical protein PLE73_03965 [Spirochaetota bacterium]|nr:hypothetical protein [Spirochaetota bacterium]
MKIRVALLIAIGCSGVKQIFSIGRERKMLHAMVREPYHQCRGAMEGDMAVDTTMYVHKSTLGLVKVVCTRAGLKRNRAIVLLLKGAMTDRALKAAIGRAIRYQGRDRKDNWRTVHVRLREDEADYFKDLRNVLKLSVSLILAIAARRYLAELVRKAKQGEKMDNYPFSHYVLSREEQEDGMIFWKICWGFPEHPEHHFRL